MITELPDVMDNEDIANGVSPLTIKVVHYISLSWRPKCGTPFKKRKYSCQQCQDS